jgi:NAD(P)H dehydrogenase (quinone)
MNHLVVLANPRETSFTYRVARAYIEQLGAAGHQVTLRDLYAMRFNPVASSDDLSAMRTGNIAADIRIEIDHVRAADVITFIAPVWWISTPAILKGWIDRVFLFGFAYGYRPDGLVKRVQGLLPGKRGMVFTSAGSTTQEFLDTGKMAAIRTMWGIGTVEFCGLALVEHVHFAPVGSRATPEMIEGFVQQARDVAARHFPREP